MVRRELTWRADTSLVLGRQPPMPDETSDAADLRVDRRLGELERGSWWSAVDRHGNCFVCASVHLDPGELAFLQATQRSDWGGPEIARVVTIERRHDGMSLVAYRGSPLEGQGRTAPLAATDASSVFEQLLTALVHMHRAGVVHAGIGPSAIERVQPGVPTALGSDDERISARLRGVGVPSLPGRVPEDDLYELSATIDALIGEARDHAELIGVLSVLKRALGPETQRHVTAEAMLEDLRSAGPRERKANVRGKLTTEPGMLNALRARSHADGDGPEPRTPEERAAYRARVTGRVRM